MITPARGREPSTIAPQGGVSANRIARMSPIPVAMLLLFAWPGTLACGAAAGPAGDAAWTPAPELAKQLGEVAVLHTVSIQPPASYLATPHPQVAVYEAAGIKVRVWQDAKDDDATASLTVIVFRSTLKEAWDADEFLGGFMTKMRREWKETAMTEIKKGRVGRADAVQAEYKGTIPEGGQVRGFLFAFNDEQGTVMVNCMTSAEKANTVLPLLRSSALTCKRGENKQPPAKNNKPE